MTCGIFCIRNKKTGDCYVGSAEFIEIYFTEFEMTLTGEKHYCYIPPLMQEHWQTYGKDGFSFEILEKTPPIAITKNCRQRYWVRKLKATYNNLSYKDQPVGEEGIYSITNTVTGDCYIGASSDIQARWDAHKRLLTKKKHYNKRLQKSWNRYSAKVFKFNVIERCDRTQLREREMHWMLKLKPRFNIKQPQRACLQMPS